MAILGVTSAAYSPMTKAVFESTHMSFARNTKLQLPSMLMLGLTLASGAMAQIAPASLMSTQVVGDTHEFSGMLRPAVEPPRTGPQDEARFKALQQGGPWSAADMPPLPRHLP